MGGEEQLAFLSQSSVVYLGRSLKSALRWAFGNECFWREGFPSPAT